MFNLALPQFDLPRAGRALRVLLRNPDDLPQVFVLIQALSGTAPHRMLHGFRSCESGKQLLRDEPDIVKYLGDRAWLAALPEGSLGRAYLDFVESEGISAKGIRDASEADLQAPTRPQHFEYIHRRLRDTHDLWHAAIGYKGDVLGELSLLSFTLAQHWNTGVALIIVAAILKGLDRNDFLMLVDGFRRGKSAAWLPAQDWEQLLALPVTEVRKRLRLADPPVYTPVRTAELRAQGVI